MIILVAIGPHLQLGEFFSCVCICFPSKFVSGSFSSVVISIYLDAL
jgi:hypothetical protein